MASRGWFDSEKLLTGERLARSGTARLRIDVPPRWWAGRLILTSERLFFLPEITADLVNGIALWLTDVREVAAEGDRLYVLADGGRATFDLTGAPPVAAWRARRWAAAVRRARASAERPATVDRRHRAAG